MPVIRRTASEGDWLIGMGGKDLKATGRCIYAMRVTGHMMEIGSVQREASRPKWQQKDHGRRQRLPN
jgi:Nucleotide modification associated domain 2